ncbi:MAG: hypothetical protein FIB01_12795 [Gemmatimonadetes bacterium]|nr:hypothetical protein [Gemmatimonadota bacterium]
MTPARLLRSALLIALAGVGPATAGQARAQVPAAARWQTIESAHFRVTFTAGLEPLARHAATAAERAREGLTAYLARPPAGRIDIVLADNVDYSNGSTTPFPSNRIQLYAKPPVDVAELNYYGDWLDLVLVHELAHAFHLDATSRFGSALRRVFGRVPVPWPLFPAIGSPGWGVEGLAGAAESGLTDLGRLRGTHHDMVARTAALEAEIDDIDRLAAATPVWPGYQRAYVYGSLFIRHLQQQHGDSVVRRIVNASASAVIPPPLWYDRVGQRAVGARFRVAYDAWRDSATRRYRALADTLRAGGLSSARTLVRQGGWAAYPRWSRDGRRIAYAHNDRRSTPTLRVIDASSGAGLWARRHNTESNAAWLPDGSLLTSDLEFTDRDHLFLRLERFTAAGTSPLPGSNRARLQDVDVSADGAMGIAVENAGGTNRLVRFDPRSGDVAALTDYDPRVQWAGPRWSPRADLIAVSRWTAGGRYDVVILDARGGVRQELTDGIGINSSPAWSPDGRYVVFSSDRSGIANLYAFDRAQGKLAQLSNVLTGAFQPDVSPDGRSVAFSAYHHDGYHIEVLPFDPAAFRDPSPARLPALPALPGPVKWPADSSATGPQPYDPVKSAAPRWWAPAIIAQDSSTFWGISTGGLDLVGRHAWSAWAAISPDDGRSQGGVWYEYRGFPSLAGTALQPSLQLALARDWDRLTTPPKPGDPYIDEREDVLSARTAFLYRHFRSVASVTLGAELVKRRRLLMAAPGKRLLDPEDGLIGARVTTLFSTAHRYPFSISAEDGITVQIGVRQRWDRSPSTGVNSQGDTVHHDAGWREVTAWSAGYLALGRVAFANAVLGLRGSALVRDGPGAGTEGVGDASGGALPVGSLIDLGGSRFLPVRGFPASARRGTRAWSATAELRVPLALLAFKPRPLPFYLDRLSAAAFVDAGDAACAATEPCDPRRLGPALVGMGAELWLDASILGGGFLLRAGGALPARGGSDHEPRWYLQVGTPF